MLKDLFDRRAAAVAPQETDPAEPVVGTPGIAEVVIEVESKDPAILGSGGSYVRCRTCGRDIGPVVDEIPDDAECPECGAFPFVFDVSQ